MKYLPDRKTRGLHESSKGIILKSRNTEDFFEAEIGIQGMLGKRNFSKSEYKGNFYDIFKIINFFGDF